MKKTFLAFSLMLFAGMAMAQSSQREFKVNVTSDGEANLTCFLPNADKASGRSIVVLPGGAYQNLAMDHEGTAWSEFFLKKGIACFVLKYRMPHGDRTKPISDAFKAIEIVRDSANAWNLNPNDVGIMGFSAGGHLASTVCTHADFAHRPNFSILFYPVISMDPQKGHGASSYNFLGNQGVKDKKLVDEYTNDKKVQPHVTPPTLILLSNDDAGVPPITNGVAYYMAMQRAGNICSIHVFPDGGHGFGYKKDFPHRKQMLDDISNWLNYITRPDKNAVRVACIGNSITFGSQIFNNDKYGYPAQLQSILGNGYIVKNFGIGGRVMLNKGDHPYMKESRWKDAQAFDPNIAVIMLGTNDSKGRNWKYGNEFAHDMQLMIDTLKALPSHPKIYLVYPIVSRQKVVDEGSINNEIIEKEIMPIIDKVAKKNKCGIIDMRKALDNPKLMNKDYVHPNRSGASEMAKNVAQAILEPTK